MSRQYKPRVISPCIAEKHNTKSWSRIVEFSGHVGGGLIEISDWTVDGKAFVRVEPYRLDDDVRIRVDAKYLDLTHNQREALKQQLAVPTRFTVRGRGKFPLDMLRRDQCWPVYESDSERILNQSIERDIHLYSAKGWLKLTRKRWESFSWIIVETDRELARREEASA